MIIAVFILLVTATLALGCWMGNRWARVGLAADTVLDERRRGWDINDAADMAETACDWGGTL